MDVDDGNYLELEPLILERLQSLLDRWPTLAIEAARDLAAVLAKDQRLPSLCVLYQGDASVEAADGIGEVTYAAQRWAVVVAVRDLRDAKAGRLDVGRLAAATIARLQGWPPHASESGANRLQREPTRTPIYTKEGTVYLPLVFTCRVVSRGAIGSR